MRKLFVGTIIALSRNQRPFVMNQMISVPTHFDSSWAWDINMNACNCELDRQGTMIGMASDYGKSTGELDDECKAYRECHECSIDQCIGKWAVYDLNEKAVCKHPPDTCKRAVCECNHAFLKMHGRQVDFQNNDVHHHRCRGLLLSIMFWSTKIDTTQMQVEKIGIFKCILPLLQDIDPVFDNELVRTHVLL